MTQTAEEFITELTIQANQQGLDSFIPVQLVAGIAKRVARLNQIKLSGYRNSVSMYQDIIQAADKLGAE